MKKAFSKILLIFILAMILGAAYFIWQAIAIKKNNQGPTVKAPDIQVIVQGDNKIVKNLTDGYQVTIPKEWDPTKVRLPTGLNIITPEKESCNYSISKIPNPTRLSAKEWFNSEYGDSFNEGMNMNDFKLSNYSGIEVVQTSPRENKSIYLNIDNFIFGLSYYPLNQRCDQQFQTLLYSFKNI